MKVKGQVVSVSEAGDLVTDIPVGELTAAPRDESVHIKCEGHMTRGIFPTDHKQPDMTFVAIEGTHGFLELLLVGDDASKFLGIKSGHQVQVHW